MEKATFNYIYKYVYFMIRYLIGRKLNIEINFSLQFKKYYLVHLTQYTLTNLNHIILPKNN